MFSLIITIISIALVAALALATLYFGGDAFNQGSAKASAATVVNQAQQISGANTLHFLDKQVYGTVADLTVDGKYLASAPNPGALEGADANIGYQVNTATGVITLDLASQAVCDAVNEQAGVDITAGTPIAPDAGSQFSCWSNTSVLTFEFK